MPKSTPRPTNSTANAIDSRFSEPTIIRPTAVVIARPMNRLTKTAKMILPECSAIQRISSTTARVPMPLTSGAFLHGGELLVGDRHRPGQADPGTVVAGEIEIDGRLADRVGGSLARLQCLKIEHRLDLDEGALVGIGQRGVAHQRAPGERGVALVQDVLDGLGDHRERPRGAVQRELSSLDAGQAGFQCRGQAAQAGIAGHDLDQRRRRLELAGHLADLLGRQEQQPVLVEKLPAAEPLDRVRSSW